MNVFNFIAKWDGDLNTIDSQYKAYKTANQPPKKQFMPAVNAKDKTKGDLVVAGQKRNQTLLGIFESVEQEWNTHTTLEQTALLQKLRDSLVQSGKAQSLREKVKNFLAIHKDSPFLPTPLATPLATPTQTAIATPFAAHSAGSTLLSDQKTAASIVNFPNPDESSPVVFNNVTFNVTVSEVAHEEPIQPKTIQIPWAGWTIQIDEKGRLLIPDGLQKELRDEALIGILSCMHPDVKAQIKTLCLSKYPRLTHESCTEVLQQLPNVHNFSDILGHARFYNAEIRFSDCSVKIPVLLQLFANPSVADHKEIIREPRAVLNERSLMILEKSMLAQVFARIVCTYQLDLEAEFRSGLKILQLSAYSQLGADFFKWFKIEDGILRFESSVRPFINDEHLMACLEALPRHTIRDLDLEGTKVGLSGKKQAQLLLPSLMKEFEPMVLSWIFTLDGRDESKNEENRKILRSKVKTLDVSQYELTPTRLAYISKRYRNLEKLISASGEHKRPFLTPALDKRP